MYTLMKTTCSLVGLLLAVPAAAQIVFYEREDFNGRTFSTERQIENFDRSGFNDRASSVVVLRDRWEICENSRFDGQCMVLRPGRYPSLASMGMNNRVSSVRMVGRNTRLDDTRYAPTAPVAVYDDRRRPNERIFQANVTSVRAVVGPTEQRCWIEREQVSSSANLPGAVAGAVIGGVIGHQIGSGRGQDVATVGGLVAGAAIGSNVDRDRRTQDVQRCATVPSQARPDYWDVTYNFRGQEHRVQMTYAPGATIRVNNRGEPRN